MPVGSLDLNRRMGCDSGRFRFLVGSAGWGLCHVKAPCRSFLEGIFLQRLLLALSETNWLLELIL